MKTPDCTRKVAICLFDCYAEMFRVSVQYYAEMGYDAPILQELQTDFLEKIYSLHFMIYQIPTKFAIILSLKCSNGEHIKDWYIPTEKGEKK